MRKILFGHPLGNPNAREAALALKEAGLLDGVATSFVFRENSRLAHVVNLFPRRARHSLLRQLGRRAWLPDGVADYTRDKGSEVFLSAALAVCRTMGTQPRNWIADALYRSFDGNVAWEIEHRARQLAGVYLYEDGAARSFISAKAHGLKRIYDLPTAHHAFNRTIAEEEYGLHPEFKAQLRAGDSREKRERKDEELALADRVIVASQFVAESLKGVVQCPVDVVPYGAPADRFTPHPSSPARDAKPFRSLYVGRVGPRKGVHYLLEAYRRSGLPEEELELVGVDEFPGGWLQAKLGRARYRTALPHDELQSVYRSGSVFVFPTLSDGFGLVVLEAMACGLPVIATQNSGAAGVVRDGIEGFVIPIRDVNALADRLTWCREHPKELAEMGKAARRRAEEFSWSRYRAGVAAAVQRTLATGGT